MKQAYAKREGKKAGTTPLPMRTNRGCFNLLDETGTQVVSEMDANSRERRETQTKEVQNRKLPSRKNSRRGRIEQIFFPLKRWIIAGDGRPNMAALQ